jgi:hypothetical protein
MLQIGRMKRASAMFCAVAFIAISPESAQSQPVHTESYWKAIGQVQLGTSNTILVGMIEDGGTRYKVCRADIKMASVTCAPATGIGQIGSHWRATGVTVIGNYVGAAFVSTDDLQMIVCSGDYQLKPTCTAAVTIGEF